MKKKGQNIEVSLIELQIEEIMGTFPAPIVMYGNSYYCRLDPAFLRFWELEKGDQLLMTITRVKRVLELAPGMEEETR